MSPPFFVSQKLKKQDSFVASAPIESFRLKPVSLGTIFVL